MDVAAKRNAKDLDDVRGQKGSQRHERMTIVAGRDFPVHWQWSLAVCIPWVGLGTGASHSWMPAVSLRLGTNRWLF